MPRRTTIQIDDALLTAAQDALGTTGLKDTVDSAFVAAVRADRRRRLARRLQAGSGVDFDADTAALARTWRTADAAR